MSPNSVRRPRTSLVSYFLQLGKLRIALVVGLGVAAAAGSALQVALTARVVASGHDDLVTFGAAWTASFLALVAIQTLTVWLVSDSSMRIRLDLARRAIGADLRTVEKAGTAPLLGVLTEDVSALAGALEALPTIGTNALIVAAGVSYLAVLSPSLAVVHLGAMLVAALVSIPPLGRGMQWSRKGTRIRQSMIERFRLVVTGTKELKLDQGRRRWNEFHAVPTDARGMRDNTRRAATYFAIVGGMSRGFAFAVIAITVFVGRSYLDASPEHLATFAITTFFLLGPIEGIIARLPQIAAAQAAIARIEDVGLALNDHRVERQTEGYRSTFDVIEMEDLAFTYDGQDSSFGVGPFDFELRRGQIVFIVGGNGSGKSTFAKLLCGLYAPQRGRLAVDGVGVTDANRDSYRQLFTSIFVDYCLFPELTSASETLDVAGAEELIASLGLADKVRVVGNKLSTTDLSTGQRKRLALVSAYLRDPAIFVFDEWAADQDPAFRRVFYRQIIPSLKERGKTVIAITHDEAYFDAADLVLKLDEGHMVNEPTRLFMARLTGAAGAARDDAAAQKKARSG